LKTKKKLLNKINWSLYAIIDQGWLKGRSIQKVAEQMIHGGAGIIQYRDKESETISFYKEALKLSVITKKYNIPLIINDRLDIAIAVEAEGLHLGQKDLPLDVAYRLVGNEMIIGISVSRFNEFSQSTNADYYGIGALYPTQTKKNAESSGIELIRKIRLITHKPLIGIGGINLQRVREVISTGCEGVAVISGLLGQEVQDIKEIVNKFVHEINNSK
jgi:thiamine-phosphate pyrophosphorylase